jgi:hypothetical protein
VDIIQQVLHSKNVIIGATSSFAYDDYVAALKLGEDNQIIILNELAAQQSSIPPGPIVLRAGIQEYDTLRIKDAYLSINDPFILNTVGTGKFTSLTVEEAKGAYKKISEIADLMGVNL